MSIISIREIELLPRRIDGEIATKKEGVKEKQKKKRIVSPLNVINM